ncbi:unnamed protein product [Trypanosoma congolense IL3000]|uniref:WGS project CAEQ00000000 data, annotated contig 1236 n=1 Tax=Trypanosoma congolense (strain IL3000) TaxID=1068625 RepID=F9W4V3_TRYCI|nr:unnamed protein product [Trypanosoma congolense IL3000]
MSMNLFNFGHPCEHQLRRTCIGGTSCPLNGYPDSWCCSYIKGKINFKRDKPCEGLRCRWGFLHPPIAQFEIVTQVLNESRPIAQKIEEGKEEILTFSIENNHIVDTVQCALRMLHNPPSTFTAPIGQLLAYAALRARDTKVFMQLLKTVKKPVDGYLLGAYDYLMRGALPPPIGSTGSGSNSSNGASGNAGQGKAAGKKSGGGNNSSSNANSNPADKKEDISDELKNDMVDLMNAALSSGGQLVNREDQHTLQAVFIQALRSFPKSNKKRQEMLELAVAKFGTKPGPKSTVVQTPANTTVATATVAPTAVSNNAAPAKVTAAAVVQGGAAPALKPVVRAAESAPEDGIIVQQQQQHSRTQSGMNTSSGSGSNGNYASVSNSNGSGTTAAAVVAAGNSSTRRTHPASGTVSPSAPAAARAKESVAVMPPSRQQHLAPIAGISQLVQPSKQAVQGRYDPIRTDLPLPNITVFGGLFGLTPQSATWAPLGSALSRKAPLATQSSVVVGAAGVPANAVGEVDEKTFRFLSPTTSGVNFFGGIDTLAPEHQLLKRICDD